MKPAETRPPIFRSAHQCLAMCTSRVDSRRACVNDIVGALPGPRSILLSLPVAMLAAMPVASHAESAASMAPGSADTSVRHSPASDEVGGHRESRDAERETGRSNGHRDERQGDHERPSSRLIRAGAANRLPSFIRGPVRSTTYDGRSDDLLTAGLGAAGIAGPAPAYADPLNPTPAELRRNAIHANYRALVDYTAAGGYGRLFGPGVDAQGNTGGDGRIAGTEHIAVSDPGDGSRNVVLMVQVPSSFDPARPCIVTATSSGSRGIYGAIGTAGDWGLKHGCAVAYTDKGTGNGLYDMQSDKAFRVDGVLAAASDAGIDAHFRPTFEDGGREAFNRAWPNRVAYKHAHSRQNPERLWGQDTLQAVELAFYVLNEAYGKPRESRDGQAPDESARDGKRTIVITPDDTVVIASSVSNGGGAAIAAAEQDAHGLIDAVAVAEPNAQPRHADRLVIRSGNERVPVAGRSLIDYVTFANVFQPCALLAPDAGNTMTAALWTPEMAQAAQNRCAALKARGLVKGNTTAAQAADALRQMHDYGWLPDSDALQGSHFRLATNSIVVTYANAYGRFGVTDNLCGYSLANTGQAGAVVPQAPVAQASLFATGNGIPPTTGVNIVWNDSVGGPAIDFMAVSPTSKQPDFALDGALCMRSLAIGADAVTGEPLKGDPLERSRRIRRGVGEVLVTGKLRGMPAIIVAGRSDALLPVNHAARAYYGISRQVDPHSSLRYYEVTNAQHFDGFLALGPLVGYDTRAVPLHVYFNRAMDLIWKHVREGASLPPSQVVRTTARAPGAALQPDNVPAIASEPAPDDRIMFTDGELVVPR